MVWASISTLLNYYFKSTDLVNQYLDFNQENPERSQKINQVVNDYMTFIIMGTLPFISFFSKLFWRKHKLNFTEHLIINAYGNGMVTSIGLISFLLYLHPSLIGVAFWVSNIINFGGVGYVFSKTFEENIFLSILKYILSFALAFLSVMIMATIGTVIYLAITKGLAAA